VKAIDQQSGGVRRVLCNLLRKDAMVQSVNLLQLAGIVSLFKKQLLHDRSGVGILTEY
jgi:hypothetical protein